MIDMTEDNKQETDEILTTKYNEETVFSEK